MVEVWRGSDPLPAYQTNFDANIDDHLQADILCLLLNT